LYTNVALAEAQIIFSMLIKFGIVAALGASAVGVLIFEVLLNATSIFVRLPVGFDRWLRWFVVTPDGRRDQQQFRLQLALVGSPARHLPRSAGGRP
jgi:hypothetical protein